MSLTAEILTNAKGDLRGAPRRTLRLRIDVQLADEAVEAEIRNLSETGLLVETTANLRMGEILHVDLPQAGPLETTVVWSRGRIFGCQFKDTIPKGVLSAAMLRSANERSGQNTSTAGGDAAKHVQRISEPSTNDIGLLVWVIGFAVLMLVAIIALDALLERWPASQ